MFDLRLPGAFIHHLPFLLDHDALLARMGSAGGKGDQEKSGGYVVHRVPVAKKAALASPHYTPESGVAAVALATKLRLH